MKVYNPRTNKSVDTTPRKLPTMVRDFICVRPDSEEFSVGGIFIPTTAKDPNNPDSGVVLGVGCGLVEGGVVVPLVVKVGERIRFPKNSGTLCKDDPDWGETVFVLRENQVFWRA